MPNDITGDPQNFLERVHDSRTVDETRQVYDDWASTYDQTMSAQRYQSPWIIASIINARVSDKATPILDVGCGTGMSGSALSNAGFSAVDGIDLSPEMLEQARTKDIYRTLTAVDLMQPIEMQDETYGAAISVGTFTVGHVGPDRIPEIMRLIKPRGLFAFTVRVDAWRNQGYGQMLNEFGSQGLLTVLDDQIQSHFEAREQRAHFVLLGKN